MIALTSGGTPGVLVLPSWQPADAASAARIPSRRSLVMAGGCCNRQTRANAGDRSVFLRRPAAGAAQLAGGVAQHREGDPESGPLPPRNRYQVRDSTRLWCPTRLTAARAVT